MACTEAGAALLSKRIRMASEIGPWLRKVRKGIWTDLEHAATDCYEWQLLKMLNSASDIFFEQLVKKRDEFEPKVVYVSYIQTILRLIELEISAQPGDI